MLHVALAINKLSYSFWLEFQISHYDQVLFTFPKQHGSRHRSRGNSNYKSSVLHIDRFLINFVWKYFSRINCPKKGIWVSGRVKQSRILRTQKRWLWHYGTWKWGGNFSRRKQKISRLSLCTNLNRTPSAERGWKRTWSETLPSHPRNQNGQNRKETLKWQPSSITSGIVGEFLIKSH